MVNTQPRSETDTLLGTEIGHREADIEDDADATHLTHGSRFSQYRRRCTRLMKSLSTHYTLRDLLTTLLMLVPSYIRELVVTGRVTRKATHKISSLDGLRGVACVIVLHGHWAESMGQGDTKQDLENRNTAFPNIQWWPFVYNLWNSHGMVSVFFVISGYVLSYKAVKIIRSKSSQDLQSCLASAIFRRALRLYLPCLAVFVIAAIAAQLHVFDHGNVNRDYINRFTRLPKVFEFPAPLLPSFIAQLQDVFVECLLLISTVIPWTMSLTDSQPDILPKYAPATWTIPVEFRCSMLVFVFLLGTSRLRVAYRLCINISTVIFSWVFHHHDVCLFLAGMVMVETDLIRHDRSSLPSVQPQFPAPLDTKHNRQRRPGPRDLIARIRTYLSRIVHPLVVVIGLYLLGTPVFLPEELYGFKTIMSTVNYVFSFPPGERIANEKPRVIGAIMTVWSVTNWPVLGPLFTNPVSHYLGQISYAFYLVHGLVIWSLGFAIIPWLYRVGAGTDHVPVEGVSQWPRTKAWVLGYVIILPLVLWLADLFWRAIDQRSVRFAHWLETILTVDEKDNEA